MAVFYTISPLDIVPDVIPIYGWIDDVLILVISILNLVQPYLKEKNETLAKKIKRIKWAMIGVAPLAIIAIAVVIVCKKFLA